RDDTGNEILYKVDPNTGDRLKKTVVIGELGGNDDLVTQYTYLANGLLDIQTDPLGRVTDYDYDALGRVTKTTYAKGTPDAAVVTSEYDLPGNRTASVDANGNRTTYE